MERWHRIFEWITVRIPYIYFIFLSLASCTLPEDKKVEAVIRESDTASVASSEENAAHADTSLASLPVPEKIRRPRGIYRAKLPFHGGMEQTVAFYNDQTFELQEKYAAASGDSVVVTSGNWSPSDGFIWLYKDQLVRGRYRWNGDTLQYFSPVFHKSFSLQRLHDVLEDAAWRNRAAQGLVLYGMGNGSSWTVAFNQQDTLSFYLPEWNQPVQMKIQSTVRSKDSIAYLAQADSAALKVVVYPFFCVDGSDMVYRNRIKVEYNNQVYHGCGVRYR